jgi:subtilisin family serine protease
MSLRPLRPILGAPGRRACQPGTVLLKLALGEAPEHVPSALDVRRRRQSPSATLDGGPIDRIVRALGGRGRYSRVHSAAASLARPGAGHRRFDDSEQVLGLARTFRVEVDPKAPVGDLVKALSQLGPVEAASPNYLCALPFDLVAVAPDAQADGGWGARDLVHASEALAYEVGDPAVVMAVVDSGVNLTHPELSARLRPGYDTVQIGSGDVGFGIQLLGDSSRPDSNPSDRFVGHGSACAAIMGAVGQAMPPGLGGEAGLLPIRALAAARLTGLSSAVGLGSISDLDAAVKLAVDLGAKVINMSFGTDDATLAPGDPRPHTDVVRYALEHGCVLVAASGNSGDQTVYWPAAHEGVVAVGACDLGGAPASFSTRGPHVALSAPGERILTASVDGYQHATGTSFAAPFVAGAAALLVARAQRRSYPLDSGAVRALLRRSASPFARGPALGCGAGILDALAALRALDVEIDRQRPDEGDADES